LTDHDRRHKRPRLLSAAEIELWTTVTADVRPFHGRPVRPAEPPPRLASPDHERLAHRPAGAVAPQRDRPPPRPAAPPPDVDHRTRVKLRRGRLEADAKLDLHGMRQAEAQRALFGFLRRAQAEGAKIAIVVTGKGLGGKGLGAEEGGVLRRMVPMWLQSPHLRDVVVSFCEAARVHGGEGALYIRIRRVGRAAAR